MKNYQDSDYALNRYSAGIVYRFADRIVEVTLEDYIAENPDKDEQDFLELKALSDADYLKRDRKHNATTKKDMSLSGTADIPDPAAIPLDERFIEAQDRQCSSDAIAFALGGDTLTEKQRRRFAMHFLEGLTQREIAKREGVTHHAVALSISYALKKIKKFFD